MKLTILYDNTVHRKSMQADWGFACLVETDDHTLLFDTGANGEILLSNMDKMNIDPLSIDMVFLSHAHFDHTGGLSAFLNVNPEIALFCSDSFRGVRQVKKVVYISEFQKLSEGIYSTGELNKIEQSLALETEKGLVLIIGCAHSGMENIVQSVSHLGIVNGVIGGFHGFHDFNLLNNIDLICPTHCTQYIKEIKIRYPAKTIDGGAGKVIIFTI